MTPGALLSVADLTVTFPTEDGDVHAVRGVSFDVAAGETVGIVGESGSGKSVSTQAVLQLVSGARIRGHANFDDHDLLTLPPRAMRQIRGARIAMVFQDPLSSLHPQYTVGWQIGEAIRAHESVGRQSVKARVVTLLEEVGIPDPAQRVGDYPHQFSGGMRQRVMLAMALALRPELLIADEPTTALDVTVQAQLLDLIARLQREHGTAVVLVTHDLGVVAQVADRVLTMYAGRIVEEATTAELFAGPHHPYTRGLLSCIPGATTRGTALVPIAGQPPSMLGLPSGCAFAPRCPHAEERCRQELPPVREVSASHRSECVLPADAAPARVGALGALGEGGAQPQPAADVDPTGRPPVARRGSGQAVSRSTQGAVRQGARCACRRRCRSGDPPRRDPRSGGRVRLGQVDARPTAGGSAPADRRHGRDRRRRPRPPRSPADAGFAPGRPGGVPGSLRRPQPAPPGRVDHR